ncbi:hypothetical protein SAMN02745181_3770 [Rubritalea squalenifaciens DSM 18772]|uniref:PsbP C-terminal domain-containing protein n=1 Tax=Rubritalea squalenifaciens DSM 18772 TaxID=1123071 RepID=A0A1M6SAL5_9BACT|nr:hypothetical protein [Rubritalea squalenifaciens]SHK41771.1 hypothetical protein SAMN02745181_3770 [Rubritalea squalenifaciens DSM 18772]
MQLVRFALLLPILLFCSCNSGKPDLSSPKSYHSSNFTFQYPGDWKITSDEDDGEEHIVQLESGLMTTVSVRVIKDEEFSCMDLANVLRQNTGDDLGDKVTVAKSTLTPMDDAHGYSWAEEKYTLDSDGLKLNFTVHYGCKTAGGDTLLVYFQTTDSSWERVSPGFDLIRDSFSAVQEEKSAAQ